MKRVGRWALGVAAVAVAASGCTSSRVMQRDQCWVRQTTKWPGQVKEDLGPCTRAEPKWTDDRLTRVVQECVAQADYRWQNRAIAAWNRGEPLPEREPEKVIVDRCTQATSIVVMENEALKERLSDVREDREQLRATMDVKDAHLRSTSDKMVAALHEAAKKPAPSAVATATARGDGKSTTQSQNDSKTSTRSDTQMAGYPQVVTLPYADAAKPRVAPKKSIPAPRPTSVAAPAPVKKAKRAPECEPVKKEAAPLPAPLPKAPKVKAAAADVQADATGVTGDEQE